MTTETTSTTQEFLCLSNDTVRLGKLLEKFNGGEIRKHTRVIKKKDKKDIIVMSYHVFYHSTVVDPSAVPTWNYAGEYASLVAARQEAVLPEIKHPVKVTPKRDDYERTKTGVVLRK